MMVVREASEFYGSEKGMASIERAIVDLYFESSREKLPIDAGEVGRMMRTIFEISGVNVSKLLKCGERRGIKGEIKALLSEFLPETPEKVTAGMKKNKHVKRVLAGEGEVR